MLESVVNTPLKYCSVRIVWTAHQRYQVPKQDLFPKDYHYRARFTGDVLNGMLELVESCEKRFGGLDSKKVLDIGCNDGSLLDYFLGKGAVTIGLEPTDAFHDAENKGHKIYSGFITEEIAKTIVKENGKPDFVTFTNVFAHIEDLQSVLNSLKVLMAEHTIIVIENHYLGSVLDRNQFDTFYHEHPRTYSYNSFVHIANSLGKTILDLEFPSRYGGNIRVFLGNTTGNIYKDKLFLDKVHARENQFINDFSLLRANIEEWRKTKKQLVQELVKKNGKLRAKAFPGRAAILIKILGLSDEMISAVYEKPNSLKIGHYVPGTQIPICSDDDLFALPDKSIPILNLAWHISHEIHSYLEKLGYTGPIFDILSQEDFLKEK